MTGYLQKFIKLFINAPPRSKKHFLISLDAILIFLCFTLSTYISEGNYAFLSTQRFYFNLLILSFSTLPVLYLFGFYRTLVRFFSTDVIRTLIPSFILNYAAILTISVGADFGLSQITTLLLLALLYLAFASYRIVGKQLLWRLSLLNRENVAVYGTDLDSTSLARALRHHPNYNLRFFIDDNPLMRSRTIFNIEVLDTERFKTLFKKEKITSIFASKAEVKIDKNRSCFDDFQRHGIRFLEKPIIDLPLKNDPIEVTATINKFVQLELDDLLGRVQHRPNQALMAKNIYMKSVLVTGAGGSIGGEICSQILALKPKILILFDMSEFAIYQINEKVKAQAERLNVDLIAVIGSVQDKQHLRKIIALFKVQTVFHAAAYKHVPLMEQNVFQCIKNNSFGTKVIAEVSVELSVESFTLVSTDKAVNSTNIMGASKRLAELICLHAHMSQKKTKFSIVRFGNVLGSSGSVVPLFRSQIEHGGPVTVTHPEVTRYFMTIPEAAQLVIQTAGMAIGGEVFILDMGRPVKIIDLARNMISSYALSYYETGERPTSETDIEIKCTGLRPGEKMYEELSYGAVLGNTSDPKILVSDEQPKDKKNIEELLANLHKSVSEEDILETIKLLESVAPDISKGAQMTDVLHKKLGM
jgi:FlaA1/EpsC-like NDP-sugar epimerase